MGQKTICIHGHFYQPPREDPLSDKIPDEAGAAPYNNWNERIFSECYLPNADQRNFRNISFNIGPTLFKWLEAYDPKTYASIISQENDNYTKYGIGNALSQPFHHVILPLSSSADKVTQIYWGIADFEHRFGHKPVGMWLPETAVDLKTLTVLADLNIKFTILAPWQINQRNLDNQQQQPLLIKLPGGREPMIVFVYHQDVSTSVSFDSHATRNADNFIDQRLVPHFNNRQSGNSELLLIASDGELYGHHKPHRDKFLAHLLNGALEQRNLALTYPGLWLKDNHPSHEVKLNEYSSWSCHHGIKRWIEECDCTPGASWKKPLRQAFDTIARLLDMTYKNYLSNYTTTPFKLRNEYIKVMLGQTDLSSLLQQFIDHTPSNSELSAIGMLLAAQYERQRMFTSCGWFFDHFHRIEPQNNIAYAAQAVWFTKLATGVDFYQDGVRLLKKVMDQETGLRGDTVFSERYQRSLDFYEDRNDYFNPSSNLFT